MATISDLVWDFFSLNLINLAIFKFECLVGSLWREWIGNIIVRGY